MKGKIAIALTAAFGGISPNLLKIAIALTGEQRRDPGVNLGYVVGLLLFAVLGGAVALIWKERDLRKAFYLGLGLPSMLQIALSGAGGGGAHAGVPAGEPQAELSLLSATAYADPLPQVPQAAQGRAVEAPPQVTFEAAGPRRFDLQYRQARTLTLWLDRVPEGSELVFASADGKVTSRLQLAPEAADRRVDLSLPDFAAKFSVESGSLKSGPHPLKRAPRSTTSYRIDIDSRFWGGFLRALGVEGARSYEFDVRPATP